MPIYKKEDVHAFVEQYGTVICAECYDDDQLVAGTKIVTEDDLQEEYYECEKCGKFL